MWGLGTRLEFFVPWREIVLFSEVTNVLSLWEVVILGIATCPLFRGFPLFGGSTIRGFTVHNYYSYDNNYKINVTKNNDYRAYATRREGPRRKAIHYACNSSACVQRSRARQTSA